VWGGREGDTTGGPHMVFVHVPTLHKGRSKSPMLSLKSRCVILRFSRENQMEISTYVKKV
jgi:hypothetical protein